MVDIILDIMGLLTGTCKTEHRERLFHAVHQITQWGMCSVDSLLYLNLHVRWSVCLSLFVTLVLIKVLCEQTRELTHDFLDYV